MDGEVAQAPEVEGDRAGVLRQTTEIPSMTHEMLSN